jgi:aspartate 1-decarboxylase
MKREMLGAKLHNARLTETRIDYEGSCAIDQDLLDAAGIAPFERVHIYNVNNGKRLDTYAIPAKRGSGKIGLNGAAARLGQVSDKVIIATYVQIDDEELSTYQTTVIILDENNKIAKTIRHKSKRAK